MKIIETNWPFFWSIMTKTLRHITSCWTVVMTRRLNYVIIRRVIKNCSLYTLYHNLVLISINFLIRTFFRRWLNVSFATVINVTDKWRLANVVHSTINRRCTNVKCQRLSNVGLMSGFRLSSIRPINYVGPTLNNQPLTDVVLMSNAIVWTTLV